MRRSYFQFTPLSLSNLYDVTNGVGRYIGQSGGFCFPFTAYSFFTRPVTLVVSHKQEIGCKPNMQEPWIEFSYPPSRYAVSSENAAKYRINISKKIVEEALHNAETLEDGRLGVYAEERKTFDPHLADLPLALLAVNLMFGDGRGTQAVAMIFNQTGNLEKIRIEQKYRGKKSTLFQARDLKDERIEQKAHSEARAEKQKKSEQEEKSDRFRF